MSHMKHASAVALCSLVCAVVATGAQEKSAGLRVVPALDLQRYAGTWFEIARLPNRFQSDCAGDVTATYTLRPDGKINVVNRCRRADGGLESAKGIARKADTDGSSAILKVRFAPSFLSWVPMVWGDYQVIALGPEYEYAVVGEPTREYLWVLSRTPQMDETLYQDLLQAAAAQGFSISQVVKTQSSGASRTAGPR